MSRHTNKIYVVLHNLQRVMELHIYLDLIKKTVQNINNIYYRKELLKISYLKCFCFMK